MNNLQLHDKMLQLAKQVTKLVENHPELSGDVEPIEHLLTTETTAGPGRQPTQSPYHRSS